MPDRPAQGLFGGIRPDQKAPKRLDFDVSVIGAYDDEVPQDVQSLVDPTGIQYGGYSTMVSSNANFSWNGTRTQFGANAHSTIRHYADLDQLQSVGHGVGVGVSTKLPWRTTLFVNQSAAYTPAYFYGVFPGAPTDTPGFADTTNPDFAVPNGLKSYMYMSQLSLTREMTRRDSLSFAAQYDYVDRVGQGDFNNIPIEWNDVSSYSVLTRYTRHVSPNTNWSGEARYQAGDYGYAVAGESTEVGAQFGLNHTKVLSGTRRLAFRVNLGVSGMDIPGDILSNDIVIDGEEVGFTRQYRGTGGAGVAYQFGRTWQAAFDYSRGVEYLPELPRPVFTDGFTVGGNGLLARRIDMSMSANYSDGASALNSNSLQFTTYAGNVRVRYAWTQNLATYGEYLYYYYHFRNRTLLQPQIPTALQRNGVRFGLTWWIPAIRR